MRTVMPGVDPRKDKETMSEHRRAVATVRSNLRYLLRAVRATEIIPDMAGNGSGDAELAVAGCDGG